MVLDAFVVALLKLADLLLTIYIWLIIIRCVISWFFPFSFHPAVRFVYRVTEPVLGPLRRIIPPIGNIDISPIVAIFIIYFLQTLIYYTLRNYYILHY
ncbi:MAG: YggT family protein [Thermodesulfobacteria bacterium]|nr:YggT family protein [Thermodesulfobacteriota bacterium]